jgi:hypothetical protein
VISSTARAVLKKKSKREKETKQREREGERERERERERENLIPALSRGRMDLCEFKTTMGSHGETLYQKHTQVLEQQNSTTTTKSNEGKRSL